MNRHSQRGVALITSLIMLSVVVLMAVTFLAVSRRERASVAVTRDQTVAKLMTDAALARAEGQIIAQMLAISNLFNYDFLVSTNFISPAGFIRGLSRLTNVSYVYANGTPVDNENDRRQLLTNLFYDPRPPVYIATNSAGAMDFRFFLDFNRNGFFESNGLVREVGPNGLANGRTNFLRGDPEWIGVLEHPEFPHSGSNLFVGRYAFMVLPAGKTLDMNFIHNHAKDLNPDWDGFHRNQGVGSWEMNLAAFLRDLNTNVWNRNQYSYVADAEQGSPNRGWAFDDANALLQYRYSNSFKNLKSVQQQFAVQGVEALRTNQIDSYSDGPKIQDVTRPWSGSDNLRFFFDGQELFNLGKQAQQRPSLKLFTDRLLGSMTNRSTDDRYTLYRLLAQLGQDSFPATRSKININYVNDIVGLQDDGVRRATNFVPWTASGFFTNAGERVLREHRRRLLQEFGVTQGLEMVGMGVDAFERRLREAGIPQVELSITNISVYPLNLFTHEVRRLLQVVANIYDSTGVRGTSLPPFPSVFRPVFRSSGTNISIRGWVEDNGIGFLSNPWLDINNPADRRAINGDVNVYGIDPIIGARKGYPNFNEFALQTSVQMTRKLELVKPEPNRLPSQTNQMYILSVSNLFGVEAWNSYAQAFPRSLQLRITNLFTLALRNQTATPLVTRNFQLGTQTILPPAAWLGGTFRVPLTTNLVILDSAAYFARPTPHFGPTNTPTGGFERGSGFYVPQWQLQITNRLQFIMVDSGRVVDLVTLTNLGGGMDITTEVIGAQSFGATSDDGIFWLTNLVSGFPRGVAEQVIASAGGNPNVDWNSYSAELVSGQDKEKAIKEFREFIGLEPSTNLARFGRSMQAPFSPTRKLFQNSTWQANDPLVHSTLEDLVDLTRTNRIIAVRPPSQSLAHYSNLGKLNERYNPWGGNTNKTASSDPNALNLAVKDPLVRSSDDWNFPTNKFPNLGTLGRVHRGTPWQTVYLKSAVEPQLNWERWAGSSFTATRGWSHPTNDWALLDLFTTAVNANAARGLLSVNQDGLAAWSAVLSGLIVRSNSIADNVIAPNSIPAFSDVVIEPGSPQVRQIVEGINVARAQRTATGSRFLNMGDVLSAANLTVNSPFLNIRSGLQLEAGIDDAAYESIPQQILSLLKEDEPRLVVYAYGQALRPAANSRILAPGPFNQMVTNYQITGEHVIKAVLRVEPSTNLTTRAVIETYNVMPAE